MLAPASTVIAKDKRSSLSLRLSLIIIVVLGVVSVYVLGRWVEQRAFVALHQQAHDSLRYQSANLIYHLNKFSLIAALTAKRPDVKQLFLQHGTKGSDQPIDHSVATEVAGLSGAANIWLVDRYGSIFSGNNGFSSLHNLQGESYFDAGFQGRLGRGTTIASSGVRYYVFASPVFVKEKVVGLVVVRVDLSVFENVWALLPSPIFATGSNKQILLSNNEAWRLRLLDELIPNRRILSVDIGASTTATVNARSLEYSIVSTLKSQLTHRQNYLKLNAEVPLLQWDMHVLVDLKPVRQARWTASIIGALLIVLCMVFAGFIFERRRRVVERLRHERAFALHLERQVHDRTHELSAANVKLEMEVCERRSAEQALKETQQELVQAAKLAGIGQMSAALAHEYNQPLAAIRSYADNAAQFLRLKKPEAVEKNLEHIARITDRMADLTKTLRSFAHKPSSQLSSISLSKVMDEVMILLAPQAKKEGVDLLFLPPKIDVHVMAEHLRLSQVVVNLLSNAMHAVQAKSLKHVEISWEKNYSHAMIWVKDTGDGIKDEIKEQLFIPFFTTKPAGAGLGLGLFIASTIVKEFQGSLELHNAGTLNKSSTHLSKDAKTNQPYHYGAVFCIRIPLAV